jgi:hypothetical protein
MRLRWLAFLICPLSLALLASTAAAAGLGLDGQGHFLIHGQPAFVRGVYDTGVGPYDSAAAWEAALFQPGGDVRATRALKNIPLNLYLNYHRGADAAPQINALMDALQNHGVLWLQTTNCFSTNSYLSLPFSTEQQPGFIDAIRNHPQLAGYYIMDECADSLLSETQQHHADLLGADPSSLTFAVPIAVPDRDPLPWTRPANGLPAASFFGTDPYALYGSDKGLGYPHFVVADEIARLRDRAVQSDPILAVLQLFKFGGGGRLPTYEEMRMHAYSSIVEGVQGVMWWEIGVNGLRVSTTKTAEITRMMGYLETLAKELAMLEPALLADANPSLVGIVDPNDPGPIAWRVAALQRNMELVKRASYAAVVWYDNERLALGRGDLSLSPMLHEPEDHSVLKPTAQSHDVRYRASTVNGTGYLIAYNYSNALRTVQFEWKDAVSAISRVGETAAVPSLTPSSAGVRFSDTFAPYQARIYVLTP